MTQKICTSLKTGLLHLDGLRAALLVINHQVARSGGVAVLGAAVVKHGLSSGTACQSGEQQKFPEGGRLRRRRQAEARVLPHQSVLYCFFFSLFFSGMRKCLCEAASLREGSHGREGLMGMRVGREVMTNIC